MTFREDELEAVLERFPRERTVSGRRMYNISRVPLEGGESYTVAVTRTVADFPGIDAAGAVDDLFQDLAPRLLLIVGIAAGMPSDEVTLGDVVVATGIAEASRSTIRDRAQRINVAPMHKDVLKWASNLPALVIPGWNDDELAGPAPSIPQQTSGDVLLKKAVDSSLKHHFGANSTLFGSNSRMKLRAPRQVTGVIAASDCVANDKDLESLYWRARHDVRAVEVKSLSAYAAADVHELPVMSIRGISEIIGMERVPAWTPYACRVAASFALAFLKARPIEPRERVLPVAAATEASSEREVDLTSTFWMKRLSLSSVRGFPLLELSLKPPATQDQGQWTILLGDNGIGKTTILRALTLALSPSDVVHAVLGRMGATSPTVRADSPKALIRLGTHEEDDLTTLTLEPSPGGEVLRRRTFTEAAMPFVVAYGSRRGSGLLDSGRSAEPTPLAAVETLFDEGASLMQPDSWLIRWQLAALQSGKDSRDARFFDAILATLCELLPDVRAVHVSAKGVEVEGPTLGRVPLGALSDGYRTTMGWILDMVARWVEEARRRKVEVDGDFHEKMTGVAVVDEIDLHLHPRWQRDVISMVRGHFPRMSFVVTTHNPLTLLGAEPGEIYVLRRNEQGDVEILQRDLPPGAGAERILTGEWFGLPSTLDDQTLELLAKHKRLIRDKGLDAPEAVKLEEELRRRLGSFADTRVERLAHQAMAEHVEKDLRQLTPEEREQARAKVAAILEEKSRPVKPAPVKSKPKTRRAKQSAG